MRTKKIKSKLKNIIEQNNTKLGYSFDLSIQFLIIISLITFSVETLPNLSFFWRAFLHYVEVITIIIFTIEYFLRLYIANRKLSFIFSFFSLIDLFAILPFYISTSIDLRSIRAIRLFRIFRMLKIVRYNHAIQRFYKAVIIAKEEFIIFTLITSMLIFLSSVGIYYFENKVQPEIFASIFHSLWWSVCTLTTVGYGDIYPMTVGGKIFTSIVLITGLGIISIPAGILASALSKARE